MSSLSVGPGVIRETLGHFGVEAQSTKPAIR